MSPLISDPFFCIVLVTITVIRVVIAAGGAALLPARPVHVPPQLASALVAYPLNDDSPFPTSPLTPLCFDHCEPQKYTLAPTPCGARSPITKTAFATGVGGGASGCTGGGGGGGGAAGCIGGGGAGGGAAGCIGGDGGGGGATCATNLKVIVEP